MTDGAIIFAQNNSIIDYTKLASFAAERVHRFLNIPVSIITDNKKIVEAQSSIFDNIIEISSEQPTQRLFYDGTLSSKQVEWKNLSRNSVYELSPYEKTLVLDSDYIINSNSLLKAFDRDALFQIYHNSFDISEWRDNTCFHRINPYSVPFYWATVFLFHKHPVIESFFDLISYIKSNWIYFKVLYNIDSSIYRNDYAFSIAIHIMNGKTNGNFVTELPGRKVYTLEQDFLINIDNDTMKFLTQKRDRAGEYLASNVSGLDVHIMNKLSLSRFIDGGTGV